MPVWRTKETTPGRKGDCNGRNHPISHDASPRGGKYVDANTEPATVIILPVIRIERDPDGSNGLEPHSGNNHGRRRRRRAAR